MKPSQLAQSLKRIASGIEASKKPNKELVIRDLKNVILAMRDQPDFLDEVYPSDEHRGKFRLFRDVDDSEMDVTDEIAPNEIWIGEHPEGSDRGGYVPYLEKDGVVYYYYYDGWFKS